MKSKQEQMYESALSTLKYSEKETGVARKNASGVH